jgi:hypothetical protein
LLIVGFASAALASETPENKTGDRYPFLEQTARQPAGASLYDYAAVRQPVKGLTAAEKALSARVRAE